MESMNMLLEKYFIQAVGDIFLLSSCSRLPPFEKFQTEDWFVQVDL